MTEGRKEPASGRSPANNLTCLKTSTFSLSLSLHFLWKSVTVITVIIDDGYINIHFEGMTFCTSILLSFVKQLKIIFLHRVNQIQPIKIIFLNIENGPCILCTRTRRTRSTAFTVTTSQLSKKKMKMNFNSEH